MSSAVRPCHACGSLVPQLDVGPEQFKDIVRALTNGSQTIAALELKHAASCSDQEATSWVRHLLSCTSAWPTSEEDAEILRKVSEAFAGIKKPEHFTNFDHCGECKEHDDTLRARTCETLQREDLGNSVWDPICFCSAEGIGYFFPSLARFALLPSVWRDNSWYGDQLISHLADEGTENHFHIWCSAQQRKAVAALLAYLMETRHEAVASCMCEDDLLAALQVWQAAT